MKLRRYGFFKELKHGDINGDSLIEQQSDKVFNFKEKCVKYLNSGHSLIVSPGLVKDVLNPENGIISSPSILTDGIWAWPEDLSYYVETYNVRPGTDFIESMKMNLWTVPDIRIDQLEF